MEYNREWEYGTPSDCDCENNFIHIDCGCKSKEVCECENILLEISKLKTQDIVLQREIDAISGASISGVTEEEVDAKIASAKTDIEAEIPSLSGYATEQWVEDKHYITGVDLSNYATTAFVSGFTYDKSTIDEKVAGGGSFDPSQYYTKTATDELLAEKLDATAYTPCDLSNYYNKTEVDNIIVSAITDVEAEIPTVPTSNTAFTNDAGYITSVDLSNYSTTEQVNSAITQAVSGKQDTLVSGTSIKTINNESLLGSGNITIQGGGATYTAGTGIDITNDVISVTGKTDTSAFIAHTADTVVHTTSAEKSSWNAKPDVWCGTLSQWSQISGNTQPNTIYLVY